MRCLNSRSEAGKNGWRRVVRPQPGMAAISGTRQTHWWSWTAAALHVLSFQSSRVWEFSCFSPLRSPCNVSSLLLQGDGWVYYNPLWKAHWRGGGAVFWKSPVFVGIKVVQYQGSVGIYCDLLMSFKKWYLRDYILCKRYPKLCYRIEFIQEPFGACVCTAVSSWHTSCSDKHYIPVYWVLHV